MHVSRSTGKEIIHGKGETNNLYLSGQAFAKLLKEFSNSNTSGFDGLSYNMIK